MENDKEGAIALHRFGVIAEAISDQLKSSERGLIVRSISDRSHLHPDGDYRNYSRATIDRWLRAYLKNGLAALRPSLRSDSGSIRLHPELFEVITQLRLELPSRSSTQIAQIIFHRQGIRVSDRTIREQLRKRGLDKASLGAEAKVYGRYEADKSNDRWITDVLVGPWVPYPKRDDSLRAKLFLIVDDHSRLLVDGRFYSHENTRSCQELLKRAITHRGVPGALYADNGAPFSNAWLMRTCAVLGIRLIHSKPYSPQGRGKQERLNRYIREAFLSEACHKGIESLEELNDLFFSWANMVANRRVHAETKESPIKRFERDAPHKAPDQVLVADAFKWSTMRKVTKTATVSLEGNSYSVDPSLVSRRVELRYMPEDLSRIEVYYEGKDVGLAEIFVTTRHVHRKVPQAVGTPILNSGIDYLGLVAKAYEEEAGTNQKVDFSKVAMVDQIDGSDTEVML